MSGKSRKPSNWGGVRPGSGRKPAYMLTDNQIKAMLRTAKKKAKEEGKALDDILLDIAYDPKDPKVQLAAIKLFKEFTMSKHTEKDINVNHNQGPKIGLPEMKRDPAKLIQIKGGSK